jgi:proline iminopeptidase
MLDVDGAQLFTFSVGAEAAEPLVMLHGGPGASHDYLRPGMDALADAGRHRLFYYDQRGGGRSPLLQGVAPAGWETHVADLEAVRRHLGLEQVTLVGYSWGALLALLYTLEHRQRVARLALVSPAPATAQERLVFQQRFAEMGRRPSVEALRARLDPSNRRHRFALAVAGYFADPERALELTPFVVRQSAEQAVWRSLGSDYDLRPRLRDLDVPAFVAHGDTDPIPIESARDTAAALRAQFVTLAQCGHASYVEAPEQLFPSLRQFLG